MGKYHPTLNRNANERQSHAVSLLRADARRDLYEAADETGKHGCGLYYVSYSNGKGPELTKSDIDELLRDGVIKPKWRDAPGGFYVLSR
jgi:hypothetical protein